jgi:hypothetical protein
MKNKLIKFALFLCALVFSFTELPAANGLYSPEDKKVALENFNKLIEQNAWNDANGLSHRNVYVFSLTTETASFDCTELSSLFCRGTSYLKASTLKKLNEDLQELARSPVGIEFYLGLDGKRYKVTDGKKQESPALEKETLEDIKAEIEKHFSTVFNDSRVLDRSVLLTFSLIDNLVIYDPEAGLSDKDKLRQIPYGYILRGPAFSKASLSDTYRASMAISGSLDDKVEKLVNNSIAYLKEYLNLPYQGAGRDFFAQYGENATGQELEQIKAIASLYEQMGDLLLEDYSDKAWQSQKPCYRVLYDGFGHWGYSWEQYRDFLQNYYEEFQTLSTELAKVPSQHRAVILLKNLNDKQLQLIPLETRLHALKTLVSESMYGHWNLMGEDEESLALRLIQHLPDDSDHIYGLLNKLMENYTLEGETLPLLEFLNKRFDDQEWAGGDGNYGFLALILAEKFLSLKQQEEMLTLVKDASLKDYVFRWNDELFGPNYYNSKFEKGLLHFNYQEVSGLQEDMAGNYSIRYTPLYTKKEFVLSPFDLVSIILEDDVPALKATKGQVLFVPAFALGYLLEDQFNKKANFCINLGVDLLSLAFGVAEIKAGVKGIKLGLALVDVSVTAGDLMVSALEEKIIEEYGAEGEAFIRSWHMVSGVASMANLGTQNISMLVEVMPAEVGKMRAFWATYKNDPKLSQILGDGKHQKFSNFVKGAEDAYIQSGHKLRSMAEDLAALANSKIDSWYLEAKRALKEVDLTKTYSNPPAKLINFAFFWIVKQTKDITKTAYRAAFKKEFSTATFEDNLLDASFDQAQRLKAKVDAETFHKLQKHQVEADWLADVLDKGVDPHKLDNVLGELLVKAGEGKSAVLAQLKGWDATIIAKLANDLENATFAKEISDQPLLLKTWGLLKEVDTDGTLSLDIVNLKSVQAYLEETKLNPEKLKEALTTVSDKQGFINELGVVSSKGTRIPRTKGRWEGVPGESAWKSEKSNVNEITKDKPIPFSNGYPDFSEWALDVYFFGDLTGNNSSDFSKVYKEMINDPNYNFKSQSEVKEWLSDNNITLHHHQDGKAIQLVPTDLHKNIPHSGGASILRNK